MSGTDGYWAAMEDIIDECLGESVTPLLEGVAQSTTVVRRNTVRKTCQRLE